MFDEHRAQIFKKVGVKFLLQFSLSYMALKEIRLICCESAVEIFGYLNWSQNEAFIIFEVETSSTF